MPENDDVNRLLDSALSTYATPPSGLEERVLRSLSSDGRIADARRRPPKRMGHWLPWAIALPACACVLTALVMLLHTGQTPTATVQQASSAPAVTLTRPEGRVTASMPSVTRRERTHSVRSTSFASVTAMPKRDVFPTPQPLTPDEQALVRYIATAPEKDRQSLLEAQRQQNKPIEISEIEIAPITTPDHAGDQGEP